MKYIESARPPDYMYQTASHSTICSKTSKHLKMFNLQIHINKDFFVFTLFLLISKKSFQGKSFGLSGTAKIWAIDFWK